MVCYVRGRQKTKAVTLNTNLPSCLLVRLAGKSSLLSDVKEWVQRNFGSYWSAGEGPCL